MVLSEIEKIFEQWAPRWIAWEQDNPGLQIGDRQRDVSTILIALDPSMQIVDEAIQKKAELLITHHPLFFRPTTSLIADNSTGAIALKLAQHNIALYSAHTNLDFTSDGVSFALARKLHLKNIRFLEPLSNTIAKIVVYVPPSHLENVSDAMTNAGAGAIGNYSSCTFRLNGKGTFRGSSETNPFIGEKNKLEEIDEVRLEMVCPRKVISTVVSEMRRVHPYEEPAFDIYNIQNTSSNYGMGAVGKLGKPTPLGDFLSKTVKSLKLEGLRYIGNPKKTIQTVAVCGGAGSDLFIKAAQMGADAFVTADIKYHTFKDAGDEIALIDAGHWETEIAILKPLADYLRKAAAAKNTHLRIFITKKNTNPIKYYPTWRR
jgi:dinuclear metal center YbgI/SA1388 family protein